jgi:RNA 3'-terminal phosphate cyclase-like protein
MNTVKLNGSNYLRQRIILATLSGKSLKITKIRESESNPGVTEEEMNLLRLVESFTNGTTIKVNETGTVLFYSPGMLTGGTVTHKCHKARAVSYYLEVLLALGPFCSNPLRVTLTDCITNSSNDISIDTYAHSVIPVMKQFGLYDRDSIKFEIKINKRGAAPGGGGEVLLTMPNPKKLRPAVAFDQGKIRRIRGVAYSTRVSPQTPGRIVESARGILNQFLPDIFIFADVAKGQSCGKSPGYGCTLVAESTNENVRISAEIMSNTKGEKQISAEELGQQAALRLLEELNVSGVCDSVSQPLLILLSALNQADVSKILTGMLTAYSIELLRNMKLFLGVSFRLELIKDEGKGMKRGEDKVLLTCIGVGYQNMNKQTL